MESASFNRSEEDIILRVAEPGDAELIADLSRATFFETFYAHNKPENMSLFLKEQFTRRSLIAEIPVASNEFILAYAGNEVAGYMKLRDGNNPTELEGCTTLEIARLYAATKMIGRGVGKILMEKAHEVARAKNRETLWLAVWEKNDRALKFYESWGFEIIGKQIFVLGMDLQTDWIMRKRL